ncbi:MAG: hypothetical protein Q4Q00_10250 [Turicibacter sp.]|nr:hypothetical protein [Turicibacter sp.]
MQNSLLLQSLKQQVLPKVVEVTEVTNTVYKGMLELRNTTIKQKQNDYHEAYQNASMVNLS